MIDPAAEKRPQYPNTVQSKQFFKLNFLEIFYDLMKGFLQKNHEQNLIQIFCKRHAYEIRRILFLEDSSISKKWWINVF